MTEKTKEKETLKKVAKEAPRGSLKKRKPKRQEVKDAN